MTSRAGTILRLAAAVGYLSRPVSCAVVLGTIPLAGNPYSSFDYHGTGVIFGWVTTLLLSPLAFFLIREGTKAPVALTELDAGSAVIVLLTLLFLGTPSFGQYAYLTGLPLSLSWPVALSSGLWFVIAGYLSLAAVTQQPERS